MATGKKYDRTIEAKYKNENIVTDVYRVLDAFEVKSQPRGHAAKKILCAGLRGKGDEFSDIVEAIDALLEDAEITRRKARKEKTLSPKHLARLEILRRAEDIFNILMLTEMDPSSQLSLDVHLDEIVEAGKKMESPNGHLDVTISDSAESSRGWKEDGL